MQKITHRITVVSEGMVFEGHRTPRAFVWRELELARPALLPPQSSKESPPTAAMVNCLHDWLRDANLSKEDKALCRRRVAIMSRQEVQQLTRLLPGCARQGAAQ